MRRAIGGMRINRGITPDKKRSATRQDVASEHNAGNKKEQGYTSKERQQITKRREKILSAREHNTNTLAEVGIHLSPKTGRNLIKNSTGVYPTEVLKKQIAYVKKKQQEFRANETPKEHELKRRSDLAEEIITAQLTKCLRDEFYLYRSNLFGDIRGGYDIVGIDRETGETEFVIDVTLGKNDPRCPINREKIEKTYRANRNGVVVYDGYHEQEDNTYMPTYAMMVPLLSISLPDRTPKGEDNLINIIDRMSPSSEEPSKKEYENTLYLLLGLTKSLHSIKDIYDPDTHRNLFNIPEMQKRVGQLYGMLSPEEKSGWKSVSGEVHFEIERWRERVEDLEDRFYEIEKMLEKKANADSEILWEMI